MRPNNILFPMIILALVSCATITQQGRMEKFERVSDGYEFSLLDADFRAAARLIHGSVTQPPFDEKHYRNIKIVEYNLTRTTVSSDLTEIEQDVELQYFLRNSNRLRTIRHHQVWRYHDAEKMWWLHTGLPLFRQ